MSVLFLIFRNQAIAIIDSVVQRDIIAFMTDGAGHYLYSLIIWRLNKFN